MEAAAFQQVTDAEHIHEVYMCRTLSHARFNLPQPFLQIPNERGVYYTWSPVPCLRIVLHFDELRHG